MSRASVTVKRRPPSQKAWPLRASVTSPAGWRTDARKGHRLAHGCRCDRRQHGHGSRERAWAVDILHLREALTQTGWGDLIGGCAGQDNRAVGGYDNHYHTLANPAKGEKPGERVPGQ
jgi:hypothetical protein